MRDSTRRNVIVTPAGRGFGNVFVIEVTGTVGGGTFTRRTWADAVACAVKYGRMFDAPVDVFEGMTS